VTPRVPLVVVGGGPAGMAAAAEAAGAGLPALLLDESPLPGGQIYRLPPEGFAPPVVDVATARGHRLRADTLRGDRLRAELAASGAEVRGATSVLGVWPDRTILWATGDASGTLHAERIVLATGARERAVPFPGWTLPGVMTAGAVQSFVGGMGVRPGSAALVAGTGPLLLVVALQLHEAGVRVKAVLEAGRPPLSPRLWLGLWSARDHLRAALAHGRTLRRAGIPIHLGHTIFAARGRGEVEAAEWGPVDPRDWRPRRDRRNFAEVDLVVAAFGLVPNTELAELAGCAHEHDPACGTRVPVRDSAMRTTVPGLFAAGDGAGIGGALSAEDEGRIAGIRAAQHAGALATAEADRRCAGPLARRAALAPLRAFLGEWSRPRPGLCELADDDTQVCRCEEVTLAEVRAALAAGARDLGEIKLRTRLGMGACQGRNCAAAAAEIVGRVRRCAPADAGAIHPRPPARTVSLGALAGMEHQP